MKGDFSRATHRSANHYGSVRLQQGRVLLDADWNEQADLAAHVQRVTSTDVVGRTGAPKTAGPPGNFEMTLENAGADLRIGPGRYYVDGILVENDDPAGTLYTAQPDLPGLSLPGADGAYAVYLDVWERHVTAVDQYGNAFPALVEPALQGPDTATRTRVIWQVGLAPVQAAECGAFVAPPPSSGQLRAQEVQSAAPVDDCLVPPGGGYRRLENQLYRVEVHDAGGDGPVVKWSRDNGSTVSKVKGIDPAALTIDVEDAGRDDVLGFASATWVELIDEERILRGEAGSLLAVSTVDDSSVVVLNPDSLSLAVRTNPTLRRWDGRVELAANTPLELESGIQVEIDGGTFRVGDYWMIPARTTTGRVEWPRDTTGTSAFQPRHGTVHHYAPLAVLTFSQGAFSGLVDCRALFPPLTAISAADVAYDPSACANLVGAATVQQAIDVLCRLGGDSGEDGIRVEKVVLQDGTALDNDIAVTPAQLASGILIACSDRLFEGSIRNKQGRPNPVCRVSLDLPWPTTTVERDQWKVDAFGVMGFSTITLAGDVTSKENEILWTPATKPPSQVQQWLTQTLMNAVEVQTHGQIRRLLARLTLQGNFIWGPDKDPELYLDGEVFGSFADDHVHGRLPSGDRRRGGDLEMWFWVGAV